MHPIRPPAVSGTWYPGSAATLATAVDTALADARDDAMFDRVVALVAPHAGLQYSGGIAAHAYRQLQGRQVDTVVIVGPSHFVAFDGVAVYARGGFDSPLGVAPVDEACAERLMAASPVLVEDASVHVREHALELQLPFIRRLLPHARILPLLMGQQDRALTEQLARALVHALDGCAAVLVASSDLSHYHDRGVAGALDGRVIDRVDAFDPAGLQALLEAEPGHACGGGPIVAVMRAARSLGARDARVLAYADSGDVSGDRTAVVGYMAAAFGVAAA